MRMNPTANLSGDPRSSYAVLRRGGASPLAASAQLALEPRLARRLEMLFRSRVSRGGGEEAQPRFARHEAHVAAVMAQGGFPSLTERRRRGRAPSVGLPLVWPAGDRP
jgi:hypothetical protein